MEKGKIQNWLIATLLFIFFMVCLMIMVSQENKIKKLSSIEKPFYSDDFREGFEHKYFNYAGVEFSAYSKDDMFYGCDLTHNQREMSVYCNIDEITCKVEVMNYTCMIESNLNLTEGIPLNSMGCVSIYTINGNLTKRVY